MTSHTRTTARSLAAVAAAVLWLAPGACAAPFEGILFNNQPGVAGKVQVMDPRTGRLHTRTLPVAAPADRDHLLQGVFARDGDVELDAYAAPDGFHVLRYEVRTGRTETVGPFALPGDTVLSQSPSADGDRLAFLTQGSGRASDVMALALVDVPTGATLPVTGPLPAGAYVDTIRTSPTGDAVALRDRAGAHARYELLPADGSPPRVLAAPSTLLSATWSPDGRSIALQTHHGLQLVDVATGARRTVDRSRRTSAQRFSHTGRYLAYTRTISVAERRTAVVIRDLQRHRTVFARDLGNVYGPPDWSPAADRFVTCSQHLGTSIISAAGKVRRISRRERCGLWNLAAVVPF